METSLWSHPDSMFGVQSSVVSRTTDSAANGPTSSRDGFLSTWIGTDREGNSCVTMNSSDRDDSRSTDTHIPEALGGEMPDSAVIAWNRIRLLMAIAPFQTLVRPTREAGCIYHVVFDGESSVNVFRYVGPLGRRFDPDEPELYVRPRCHAPALGRFLPRDPR